MAGSQCCIPAPSSQHSCAGKEEHFGPLLSYVVHPPSPKGAVLFACDAFGFEAPLTRKLADKIAAAGYFVVVPDYFNKDPYVPGVSQSSDWMSKHKAVDVVDDSKKIVQLLKSKNIASVGAVGFCWGAKVVVELAKEDCLKAGVLCHPSFVTVEDIKDVKIPIAVLAAEIDQISPPALIKQFSEILKSKENVESFVNIYPDVSHGWTVRYDPNNKKEVKKAEEAHSKTIEWFGKFLH